MEKVRQATEGKRNVAAQLQDTGIRLAMGTGTTPEERDNLEMGITLFQEDVPA